MSHIHKVILVTIQESPPASTQEAYRPPCSKYSLCCPNWVPPRPGYPPGQGTPLARVPPSARVPPWPGYPPSQGTPGQGTPGQGTPLARVPPRPGYPPARVPPTRLPPQPGYPPQAGPGRVPPWLPHGILGNVAKHYGIRVPPPCGQTEGQTRVKTLPSLVLRTRAVISTDRNTRLNIMLENGLLVPLKTPGSSGDETLVHTVLY